MQLRTAISRFITGVHGGMRQEPTYLNVNRQGHRYWSQHSPASGSGAGICETRSRVGPAKMRVLNIRFSTRTPDETSSAARDRCP